MNRIIPSAMALIALGGFIGCGKDTPSGPAGEFSVSITPDPIARITFLFGHGHFNAWADFTTNISSGDVAGTIVSLETTVTDRTGDVLYHSTFSGRELSTHVCSAPGYQFTCEIPTRQNIEIPPASVVSIKHNPSLPGDATAALIAIVRATIRDANGHDSVHEGKSATPR
jgi:hypothetical protein